MADENNILGKIVGQFLVFGGLAFVVSGLIHMDPSEFAAGAFSVGSWAGLRIIKTGIEAYLRVLVA